MRLLIVGALGGQLTTASKIAMDKGVSVSHAESNEQVLTVLRSGRGADLLMVDVALDIRDLVNRLDAERIHLPIVACGTTNDARAAVDAIHSGAKEYLPLPPDPELIAAVLTAVTDDVRDMIWRHAAEQITRNLVGHTLAEVERDLILETLKHCLGNRTHAANILGISIRTLRNKLNEYAADGALISPPHSGELLKGAAA
jgi:DNA-binding NtrC family response regulator